MGPSLIDSDFTSGKVIKSFIEGVYPGMPKVSLPVVDVRDVAFAHLQAIKVEEAANKRFLLAAGTFWFKDYSQILKDEFP